MVVVGHAGTGILTVSANIASQISETLSSSSTLRLLQADFSQLPLGDASAGDCSEEKELRAFLDDCAASATTYRPQSASGSSMTSTSKDSREILLVSVTLCAAQHMPLPSLLVLLAHYFQVEGASAVISVLSPAALSFGADGDSNFRYLEKTFEVLSMSELQTYLNCFSDLLLPLPL